jgi:hypothetical protein
LLELIAKGLRAGAADDEEALPEDTRTACIRWTDIN